MVAAQRVTWITLLRSILRAIVAPDAGVIELDRLQDSIFQAGTQVTDRNDNEIKMNVRQCVGVESPPVSP